MIFYCSIKKHFETFKTKFLVKCDKIRICKDNAIEVGCSCEEDEFTCQCYKLNPPTCAFHSACVLLEQYGDGRKDCADRSDETPFLNNVQCGDCDVTLRRLRNMSECNKIGFPSCDVSTCYKTPSLDCDGNCNKSDVICTSRCSINSSACHRPFQCSDGSLILAFQFCDGILDCPDNSDEMINQPGFVCEKYNWRRQSPRKCVLPQINLYDDIAQCENGRDLCDGDDCFECFDKQLLISFSQLCDGIFDCYDLSDECLCDYSIRQIHYYSQIYQLANRYCNAIFTLDEKSSVATVCNFNLLSYQKLDRDFFKRNLVLGNYYGIENFTVNPASFLNKLKITRPPYCHSTDGVKDPTLCDGRPECSDFSDECNDDCYSPPSFCNDPCLSHFPIGDRYCDGVEDPTWVHINKSACPQGFDEQNCPNRFKCKADGKVSINLAQRCDGTIDCDDGSDEPYDCFYRLFNEKSDFFIYGFWVMGCVVIVGNVFAIVFTIKLLRSKQLSDSIWTQYLIILNISIADFIMGVYLLTIARYGFANSGYTLADYDEWVLANGEWISSLGCSIAGSLSVISSEASCFLMVVLTTFRLRNISNPISSLSVSTLKWKICICFAWFLAAVLAIVPIHNFQYFVNFISFDDGYERDRDFARWTKSELQLYDCRFAIMRNQSMENLNDSWQSYESFFQANYPKKPPLVFGYYSSTRVCLPNYFEPWFSYAWQYTLAIISLNFISFVFIAVSYIVMYYHSKKHKKMINKSSKRSAKQEANMRKRIARIIATDFLCWIPICIFSYLTTTLGIGWLPDTEVAAGQFYHISAFVFLPINSALNPFLYSSLPDIIIKKIFCCCRKKNLANVGTWKLRSKCDAKPTVTNEDK